MRGTAGGVLRPRSPRLLLIVWLLAASFYAFDAGDTLAACNPGRANDGLYYQVGRDQTVAATGIFSKIYTYSPFVTSGRFAYSWVMLGGPSNYMWAQIGDWVGASGPVKNPHTSLQYAWPGLPYRQLDFPAQTVGTSDTMEVTYFAPNHEFEFFANGTLLYSIQITQWVPVGARISSEIDSYSVQQMGARNLNEVFDINQIQYSGTWHTYNGVLVPYNSAFGESGYGGSFNTWDGACST